MSMADKIILLNDGAIEQHDTPDNLYNNPASIFAAQFIGAPPMNIIPLRREGQHHYLGEMPIPVVEHRHEEALSLGLRAEDIQLTAADRAALTARVISYEYMGADTLLVCQIAACREPITVKVAGMRRFSEHSLVGLQWSASRHYFFVTASGKRCYGAEQTALPSEQKYAV